jgi:organic hydroperoxide reductase OsmC/OhrA
MNEMKREATIRWMNHPPEGVPRLTVGSDSFTALPLTVDARATNPLATSPGELLAAAIGSTFAWLAAEMLVNEGMQARELTTLVTLTLAGNDDGGIDGMSLSAIACQLWGRVPSGEQGRLAAIAQAAMGRCIETLGICSESVAVTVETVLEGH